MFYRNGLQVKSIYAGDISSDTSDYDKQYCDEEENEYTEADCEFDKYEDLKDY